MYRATLNVVYRNGHNPTVDSPEFLLRVTPPSATVKTQYLQFSPDGVGTQTSLPLDQTGSTEILWQGSVADSTGKTVRSYQWNESAPKSFSWDGRDDNGKLVPDGTYAYQLTSTDPAGNTGGAKVDGYRGQHGADARGPDRRPLLLLSQRGRLQGYAAPLP